MDNLLLFATIIEYASNSQEIKGFMVTANPVHIKNYINAHQPIYEFTLFYSYAEAANYIMERLSEEDLFRFMIKRYWCLLPEKWYSRPCDK
jgi:hypothetical protein